MEHTKINPIRVALLLVGIIGVCVGFANDELFYIVGGALLAVLAAMAK